MSQVKAVETDAPTLVLEGKAQARFELGACMALYLWDNLRTAVDNQWGGADSSDKRDWMVGSVVELFETGNYVDSEDIEDRLLNIMEDEFGVVIEDDTAAAVADQIITVYQECAQENFTGVEALHQRYEQRQASSNKNIVNVQGNDEDENSDSDDDNDQDDQFEEKQENSKPAKQEPIIDDDGFELVQKKR